TVQLRVDVRKEAQRLGDRLGEEGHETQADAVLLPELVLVLVAHGHDGAHVHLVEGGEHGRFVLHAHQALAHFLAQGAHFGCGALARATPAVHQGGGSYATRDIGLHIAARDAAIGAGALYLFAGDSLLGHYRLGHRGGMGHGLRRLRLVLLPFPSLLLLFLFLLLLLLFLLLLLHLSLLLRPFRLPFGSRLHTGIDLGYHIAHVHRGIGLGQQADLAALLGNELEGGLVAVDLGDHLVLLHHIAISHQPLCNAHFTDAFCGTGEF